jgi:N-acetylglucosamine-6-sulfatase
MLSFTRLIAKNIYKFGRTFIQINKIHKQHSILFGDYMKTLKIFVVLFLGISFFNISQIHAASTPTLLGQYNTAGTLDAKTVAVSGNYAYVGTNVNSSGAEFYIVNVSNPALPTIVGTREVGGDVNKILISGNYAFLATSVNSSELIVLDITNKNLPIQISNYDTSGYGDGKALALSGSTLYLGTIVNSGITNNEFYALNVSNPASITKLGSFEIGANVNGIDINGSNAYLATSDNSRELIVLNVSLPSSITLKSSYNTPGYSDANAVKVKNGLIYLGTDQGASTNFYALKFDSIVSLVGAINLIDNIKDIVIYRDRAYLTSQTTGLRIIDIGNPASLTQIATFASGMTGYGVAVDGRRTYLATSDDNKELQVLDTTYLLRPNIVVVQTDDQRWDTLQWMSNVQQSLVSQGVSFTNSFVNSPGCTPSRATFLTGEYAHHHGVVSVWSPPLIGHDSSTIATWLHSAGYKTGMFGKYLNTYSGYCTTTSCYIPPGWDEWHAFNVQASYNYDLIENGVIVHYGSTAADYSTDVLKNKTIDFIQSSIQNSNGRPFFAYLATHGPHGDLSGFPTPAPRHNNLFLGIAPWRPVSYDEEDMSDKSTVFSTLPRASQVISGGFFTYGSFADAIRRKHLEAIQSIDEAVRDIVTTLKNMGEDQDTVIVFTSDNGLGWGEHRNWGWKGMPHDESIRVPLVIRYPRLITSPRQEIHLVSNTDLAPTLAELAGTQPTTVIDGKSFVPFLRGESIPSWRTYFLVEEGDIINSVPGTTFYSIRTDAWKYVQYATGEEELFDLTNDPYEMNSVASSSSSNIIFSKAVLQYLLNQLKQ